MRHFLSSRLQSFQYAFNGLRFAICTQKNSWIHALATISVIFISLYLHISRQEWAIILLAIGSVWTAELFNTSLEAIVDLASPQIHPLAKIAKDVGAAAVLITAVLSVFIGLIILGPPLINALK